MREKGDVSMMYSYLLIESPTGHKVRRSHLLCWPRQPSHMLRSLLLPRFQYCDISPVNTVPDKLKIELFSAICPPFHPKR